jgi:hypothetical protein
MHPQPVQVDTRRLSAKLAAPLDETHYLQVSYSRKVFDWVGKCADNARGHPSPPGVGALVLVEVTVGITEASATQSRSSPCALSWSSTTAIRSLPILQVQVA